MFKRHTNITMLKTKQNGAFSEVINKLIITKQVFQNKKSKKKEEKKSKIGVIKEQFYTTDLLYYLFTCISYTRRFNKKNKSCKSTCTVKVYLYKSTCVD